MHENINDSSLADEVLGFLSENRALGNQTLPITLSTSKPVDLFAVLNERYIAAYFKNIQRFIPREYSENLPLSVTVFDDSYLLDEETAIYQFVVTGPDESLPVGSIDWDINSTLTLADSQLHGATRGFYGDERVTQVIRQISRFNVPVKKTEISKFTYLEVPLTDNHSLVISLGQKPPEEIDNTQQTEPAIYTEMTNGNKFQNVELMQPNANQAYNRSIDLFSRRLKAERISGTAEEQAKFEFGNLFQAYSDLYPKILAALYTEAGIAVPETQIVFHRKYLEGEL